MSAVDPIIAKVPGASLTLGSLLRRLHAQGRLLPLVHEALAAQLVQAEAKKANLVATDEELQAAADSFRRRVGLASAADTHAWLKRQRTSVAEFEAGLEHDVLAAKLVRHLTAERAEEAFARDRSAFDRVVALSLVAPREDLANEILTQVRDDGRDLVEVAREQQLTVARVELFRRQLGLVAADATAGKLLGPSAAPGGFALLLVEGVRPAELDEATRRHLQQELFEGWVASQLKDVAIQFPALGAP